jgi:hypothetical protein
MVVANPRWDRGRGSHRGLYDVRRRTGFRGHRRSTNWRDEAGRGYERRRRWPDGNGSEAAHEEAPGTSSATHTGDAHVRLAAGVGSDVLPRRVLHSRSEGVRSGADEAPSNASFEVDIQRATLSPQSWYLPMARSACIRPLVPALGNANHTEHVDRPLAPSVTASSAPVETIFSSWLGRSS